MLSESRLHFLHRTVHPQTAEWGAPSETRVLQFQAFASCKSASYAAIQAYRLLPASDQPVSLFQCFEDMFPIGSASVREALSELCFTLCFRSSVRRSTDPGE